MTEGARANLDSRPGVLQVEELSVAAGSNSLVRGVSFASSEGELTAVIGPNGAGKTSLLEGLVGLRSGVSGRVALRGRPLSSFRERAQAFAYLPDSSQPPPEASVATLVRQAEQCASHAAGDGQIRRLLAIEQLWKKPVGVLSQGERQRLQLYCGILLARPVLVMDEPFSAFDPLQLRDVLAAVRMVVRGGATVVASIHQLTDAERVADKVLLLAGGRQVAFGSMVELRSLAGSPEANLETLFTELLARGPREA